MDLKALSLLDRDRLEMINYIDENGEFNNYPERGNHIDYYGVRGKIIGDGIILRETKIYMKSFDMDFAPLVCVERIIIRNVEGLNKVISTECTMNANEELTCEAEKENRKAMNTLYKHSDVLIDYIKDKQKRRKIRTKYKVAIENYNRNQLAKEDKI